MLPSAVGTAPRDAQQRTRTPGLSPDLLWKLQKCPFPPCHLVPDVPEAAHLHPVKNRNKENKTRGNVGFSLLSTNTLSKSDPESGRVSLKSCTILIAPQSICSDD